MKEHLELRISKIIRETTEAITLTLEPTEGEEITYKSGQFLTLLVSIGGKELRRSYSLSSTPGVDEHPAITIKRVVNGEVSRYLIDHLQEGDILKALPPAGRFILQTQPEVQRDIFLIGAGSGLTPLFSILKDVLHHEPQSHCVLIQSDRNEITGLFTKQIRRLAEQYAGKFSHHPLHSNPLPQAGAVYPSRLSIGLLQTLIRQYMRYGQSVAQFYICGPSDYMRMARMALTFMEFRPEQVHQEIFVTEELPQNTTPYFENTDDKRIELLYRQKRYVLTSPYNQSILKTGLVNGLRLPYSCAGGVCSTCIARCTKGKVHMAINKVLTDKEVTAGWVLTCVSYPVSDEVTIEWQ
jgi:ring-1,2-phenylacetyl-CoA epoxidase subunit PaaE